ncbi:MAG: hypothetical protein IPL33_16785 [Sphingobacteriales bacterium]|nr:hypothetical protein [Sphingobacteriales bacterium]
MTIPGSGNQMTVTITGEPGSSYIIVNSSTGGVLVSNFSASAILNGTQYNYPVKIVETTGGCAIYGQLDCSMGFIAGQTVSIPRPLPAAMPLFPPK